jgi:hypothetical protein
MSALGSAVQSLQTAHATVTAAAQAGGGGIGGGGGSAKAQEAADA